MEESKDELVILIMSCDAFSDVWEPFFTLFEKYWSDCPFQIYLVCETKAFIHSKVQVINTHQVTVWSDMLLTVLKEIKSNNILFLLEDYFLNKTIQNEEIDLLYENFKLIKADCLRLYPMLSLPLLSVGSNYFGRVDSNETYFVSTQASFWRKEALINLIVLGESGWDFERNATFRARETKMNIYSIFAITTPENLDKGDYPIRYLYHTSITRGKWTMKTINFCNKNGIYLDLNKRKANSYLDQYYMGNSPIWVKHLIDFVNCRTKKYLNIDLRSYPMK